MRTKTKKPAGPELGDVRITYDFERCARELYEIGTLKEFLVCVADMLINRPFCERWECVLYCSKTGKPLEFAWKQHATWNGYVGYTKDAFSHDLYEDEDEDEDEVDEDEKCTTSAVVVMSAKMRKELRSLAKKHNKQPIVFSTFDRPFVLTFNRQGIEVHAAICL